MFVEAPFENFLGLEAGLLQSYSPKLKTSFDPNASIIGPKRLHLLTSSMNSACSSLTGVVRLKEAPHLFSKLELCTAFYAVWQWCMVCRGVVREVWHLLGPQTPPNNMSLNPPSPGWFHPNIAMG